MYVRNDAPGSRQTQVWSDLERRKGTIVEEPEAASEFKAAKRRYEQAVDSPRRGKGSALLLAVYRGKMSEVKTLLS